MTLMQDGKNKQSGVDRYTSVYVLGSTDQLGFKHNDPYIRKPKFCSYNIQIKQVACGDAHSHILSKDGNVYSMGSNSANVLGLTMDELNLRYQQAPQLILSISNITAIATGKQHTLALDNQGRVFGWGTSHFGAIGQRKVSSKPTLIDFGGKKIAQICCGFEHSFFITTEQEVYACGKGEQGQLGTRKSTNEFIPQKITKFGGMAENDKIMQISCGASHTHFLSKKRLVFASGLNYDGQLGIGQQLKKTDVATLIVQLNDKKITQIASGQANYALSTQGDLYVWGLYQSQVLWQPIRIMESSPLRLISQSFFGLTSGIDSQQRLWVWQQMSRTSDAVFPTEPKILEMLQKRKVTNVFVGGHSLFALGDEVQPAEETQITQSSQFSERSSFQVNSGNNQATLHNFDLPSATQQKVKLKNKRPKSSQSNQTSQRFQSIENSHRKTLGSNKSFNLQTPLDSSRSRKSAQDQKIKKLMLNLTKANKTIQEQTSALAAKDNELRNQQVYYRKQVNSLQTQIEQLQNELAVSESYTKKFEKAIQNLSKEKRQSLNLKHENQILTETIQILEKAIAQQTQEFKKIQSENLQLKQKRDVQVDYDKYKELIDQSSVQINPLQQSTMSMLSESQEEGRGVSLQNHIRRIRSETKSTPERAQAHLRNKTFEYKNTDQNSDPRHLHTQIQNQQNDNISINNLNQESRRRNVHALLQQAKELDQSIRLKSIDSPVDLRRVQHSNLSQLSSYQLEMSKQKPTNNYLQLMTRCTPQNQPSQSIHAYLFDQQENQKSELKLSEVNRTQLSDLMSSSNNNLRGQTSDLKCDFSPKSRRSENSNLSTQKSQYANEVLNKSSSCSVVDLQQKQAEYNDRLLRNLEKLSQKPKTTATSQLQSLIQPAILTSPQVQKTQERRVSSILIRGLNDPVSTAYEEDRNKSLETRRNVFQSRLDSLMKRNLS